MPDETTLSGLLGKRVTITSPDAVSSWTGRVIAYHQDPGIVIEQDDGIRTCLPQAFTVTEADSASPFADATTLDGSTPGAGAATRPGRRARVEVKGFRDLGVVRVTETTLAGEPMLHAECDDGSSADFPPSSLHFITWLPDGALEGMARAALPASAGGFDPRYETGEDEDGDETERLPF